MAITDELREWAHGFTEPYKRNEQQLLAIADRIDTEHQREIGRAAQLLADAEKDRDFNYANWQDCKQKVLQHNITIDELDAEIERLKDELAHRIELPKDADGEPIHMGDLVTVPWKDKVYEVAGFSCSKQLCSGMRTIWIDVYSPEKQRNVPLCGADSCRHYHAPTVEDVLREFARECLTYATCVDDHEVTDAIELYAAKLRLASDAE